MKTIMKVKITARISRKLRRSNSSHKYMKLNSKRTRRRQNRNTSAYKVKQNPV